ncbi:hypothetical protein RJ45_17140 [Photobacterium gaetbulicola]|uniref:DUF4432 domain-containing protein n=1 Tax=Photobacterium gaetbulicola TaxID=1295392 RepID=A0A0B9H119_9GAMM|nr:hypothetical protein [Photobacterium gaetbulicola]KHT62537.1 hypothetical protein RJ45_17140 [Photobacterium gaetbulicola]
MYIEIGQYLGQDGVWIENDETRLFVQAFGGMTPEFSRKMHSQTGDYWLNAHWLPHFKSPFSGKLNKQNPAEKAYWGVELLRQAAGCFPCAPAFGPGNQRVPTHGDTANTDWQLTSAEQVEADGRKFARATWSLAGNYEQLCYRKADYLRDDDGSHYMVMTVENTTNHDVPINLAWHTTLGAPFLERGCWILDNCDEYQVSPEGTEFDATSSLKLGSSFPSLSQAPMLSGASKDLSVMPGYNGSAEFISGTSSSKQVLWSACYNPYFNLVYVSAVPLEQLSDQVSPSFMNYWIHSGGRDAVPWADYPGGPDRNYALGLECSIGGSCKGYDWSLEQPCMLNKPTNYNLEAHSAISFVCINSFFTPNFASKVETVSSLDKSQLKVLIERHIDTLDISFSGLHAR